MNPMLNESDNISALADGVLRDDAFAAALGRLAIEDSAQLQWQTYHVVGDILRSNDLALTACNTAFVDRLQARLAAEAVVRPAIVAEADAAPNIVPERMAANGDIFRWKIAAGFASVAAVAAIGWNAVSFVYAVPAGEAFAASGAAVRNVAGTTEHSSIDASASLMAVSGSAAEPLVMLRNAQLDELLAAHNQAVGGAALQTQASFVRNANFANAPR